MPKATVTIKKNKDMEKLLKTFDQDIVDEVRMRIQKRAKFYSPVDTGKLRSSIRFLGKYTVGSTVRYAGYQEYGTSRNAAQPYMRPALNDVMRAMPGIMGETWRGAANKTGAGPTKQISVFGKIGAAIGRLFR